MSRKLRPQTPKTQTPRFFFKKIYIVNSSQFLSPDVLWSRNVHRQPPERSDLFIFSGLSLWRRSNSEKLTMLKIAVDTLITFAGEFFKRRKRRHRFARKNRDIYFLWFIAVASGGDKTDFNLKNIIATLSLCLVFLRVRRRNGEATGKHVVFFGATSFTSELFWITAPRFTVEPNSDSTHWFPVEHPCHCESVKKT